MARLFISCNNRNFDVGTRLERALERRKHVMTVRVNARPAGRWEEQLLRGLHTADAFISLLTPEGLESDWVVSQTGMAISSEYTRRMLVLPVCPPGQIPNFVEAFHCFWLPRATARAIETLADQLDEAIRTHQAHRPPAPDLHQPPAQGPEGRAAGDRPPAPPGACASRHFLCGSAARPTSTSRKCSVSGAAWPWTM
ncbi:MAG: toll/interleukin-1 receptor domain-containing protein [Vicinamibacterales bacterium]